MMPATTAVTAIVAWSTNYPASSWVLVEGTPYGQPGFTMTHRVRVAGLEPGRRYEDVQIFCQREDGKVTTAALSFSTPVAPKMTNIDVRGVTAAGVLIEWDTNVPADSWVVMADGSMHGRDERATRHAVEVAGLHPGETYQVVVRSGCGPSLPAAEETVIFTTFWIGGVSQSAVDGGCWIAWWTNYPSTSWIFVPEVDARFGQDDATTEHGVLVAGLPPGRQYLAQIECTRGAGAPAIATKEIHIAT